MQSFFRVSEMESTDKPPTPMAAVSDGKKFRNCANCTSRMPSIVFDAHTLCIGCRDQVCDMSVHCDECRDWSDSYRLAFVKYNRTLKAKRDSKVRRKARHSAAQSQSDQSVYDTDTEVPSIDEPIPSVQVQSDKVESVVSEAPSAEASLSDFLYVTPGDRFEQLASTLLSKMQELSDRGLHPPVQSQPVLGSGSQPIVAATDQLGVSAPLEGIILPNPINPVFRLSTAPVSDETPVHRLAASDRKLQELELNFAATRRAIDSFCDGGLEPPQSLVDSLSSLSRELVDAKRTSSELHGAIRPPSSQPGVSSRQQRFAAAAPAQPGPSQPEGDLSFAGPSTSRRRPYDFASGQHTSDSSGRSFRPGGDPPPHKRRRLTDEDSSDEERESSTGRQQQDEEEGDEENFRPASLALLLDYIMNKFPAASKPLAQPSTRRFRVFEAAGLVEESSQRSSNLSWFDHVRFACESTQSKFETKIYEGKSLSTIMPSVSKVEKVSDSPCQGKELKVNSQVYDLMGSKPSDTRSVPMSVRDAAVLEKTLRGALESYNFQLWTMTALFRFFGDSGQIPLDDPLLDQFQRSFSRGTENVAAALASAVAFVTTKRRESFLSHMVPSVTEAQKRNLLSDPIFQQKDLFAPATLDAARHAARDVSLYKGAQSRPSTSSGTTQRRPFSSSSASRGRTQSSAAPATPQRSQASSFSKRFTPQKRSSDPPKKRGGFRR